jgi:predicted ATPase
MFGGKVVTLGDTAINVAAGERQLALATLSSGEKQALRVLIETIGAEENTMIVDEPEMSLHIDWQRALIKSMREINSSAQLIIATHSPEIMAELSESQIFEL